jgi:hypothetical protein
MTWREGLLAALVVLAMMLGASAMLGVTAPP